MKKSIVFIVFLFNLMTSFAFAASVPGTWMWPINGEITSYFGWRTHPIFGTQRWHSGIDIGADTGDDIVASDAGTVAFAGWNDGYGLLVIIDHGDGIQSFYGHNSDVLVKAGDTVGRGIVIAKAGSTGYSTGPHCHFEIRKHGEAVDPALYIPGVPNSSSAGVGGGSIGIWDTSFLNWNPEGLYELGDGLNHTIKTFSETAQTGYQALKVSAMSLLVILAIIDLTLPIILGGMVFSMRQIVSKLIKYGLFMFFVIGWQKYIVDGLLLEMVIDVSGTLTGDVSIISEQISQPQLILQKAMLMITPALNKVGTYNMLSLYSHKFSVAPIIIMTLITIAIFSILALFNVVYYVEFYIIAALNVFALPLGTFSLMKHVPEGTISSLIKSTMKLLVMSFMVFIMFQTLKNAKPGNIFGMDDITTEQIISYTIMCLGLDCLAILAIILPIRLSKYFGGKIEIPT